MTSDSLGDTSTRSLENKIDQDVLSFAEWAFSNDGLPELQVLAWGDFSYEGRYRKSTALFCRSHEGFRSLTRADVQSWGFVQENVDMLAACAFEAHLL
jgi:hypothetical protein